MGLKSKPEAPKSEKVMNHPKGHDSGKSDPTGNQLLGRLTACSVSVRPARGPPALSSD